MHAYASRLVALLLAILAPLAQAGIGDVDPGYGVNGRFEVRPLGQFFVYPPLPDGRLLHPAEGGYRRIDINGMPDETFGSGGVQAWPQGYSALGTGGWARAGDGRLFVALARAGAGGDEFAVTRLAPDGSPDPGFGTEGFATIDIPPDGRRTGSLVAQPDGKLLLLLEHHDPADWYYINSALLVRLLPDGRLDAAFGDGGSVVASTGLVEAMDGVSLTLLADGRIRVLGKSVTWLTPSGAVDLDPPDGQEWGIAALFPGGRAIAWARTSAGYRIAKVMANGSFDTSFGPNGDGTSSLPAEADYLSGISVSPDGRHIFVTWGRNADGHWRVSRVIGDGPGAGALDTSFGDQGTVDLKSTNAGGTVYGLLDGGAIITTADYAYRLLGRDAPSPGITGVYGGVCCPSESDGVATLRIFRAAGSDGAIRLRYRTLAQSELPQQPGISFATPGVDFDAVDGVLDWSDGDDGDKIIRIPLRNDQVQEGTEQILVRFEALSPGSWTVQELVAVPVDDPKPRPSPNSGQGSGGGSSSGVDKSSGGGSFGWPGLLLMLTAFARRNALRIPALLLAGSAQAQLAPGDVDPGFVYPQPMMREPDSTNAVALPNGFIIVKSREAQPPFTESTLALTLIDKDGHVVDYAFGTDGTYTNHIPGAVNVATAATRLPNGALLLGGFKRVEGSAVDSVAAIAKVDMTGALDPAFGAGGVATFDVQGGSDRVGALAELPDGRIAALVWSRQYADPYGDCDVTWMVLVLLSPDGQHAYVADARLRDSWVGGCRDSFTMSSGPGGTLLYGNELNVFDGSARLFPNNWRYGPFAYDASLGLVSTTIDGAGIGIVAPDARPPGNLYPSLRTLAGFDDEDEQVTYTRLVPDLAHERFYLGLSSDGGRVAIVRFRLDGSLDTGWGRGGAVVVKDAGQRGVWLSGALATDLRLLAVQEDGSVVVVTADGIVERLAGGNGVAHGVFKLDTDYVSVTEGNGSVPIRVQRVDGASGAVTVDLVIGYCAWASTGACVGQPDAATPGEDFVESRVTLEYSDGDTSPRRVDVKLLDDSRKEPTEVFRVKLLNPTGGAQILGGDAWVAVQDNDGGAASGPSPGPGQVGQGGGGGRVGEPLLALLVLALALRRYCMRPGLRTQVIVRNGT